MTRKVPTLSDLYPINPFWNRIASFRQPELTGDYVPESEYTGGGASTPEFAVLKLKRELAESEGRKEQQRRECFRLAVNDIIRQSRGFESRPETPG